MKNFPFTKKKSAFPPCKAVFAAFSLKAKKLNFRKKPLFFRVSERTGKMRSDFPEGTKMLKSCFS